MKDKIGIVLSEASTWRGLIMLAAGLQIIDISADQVEMLTGAALSLSGSLGVLFRRGN